MLRFWLLRTAQLIASLLGAVALASLLIALSQPYHGMSQLLSLFLHLLGGAFEGNFGVSAETHMPALKTALEALPATLQLIGAGFLIAVLIGTPLGILLSASRTLRAAAPLMQIVAATPVFVGSLGLIWLSTRVLHWGEPGAPTVATNSGLTGALHALLLPVLIVGAAGTACVQLYLRRAGATAWSAPYRTGLRMMGLSAWDIDVRFALPEILAALLANLGEILLSLISAATIVEWMFHRDGAAVLFLNTALNGDWNVAASALLIFAVMKLGADFIGSVCARFLAPEDGTS